MSDHAEVMKALKKKTDRFREVFGTPQGQEVLEYLRLELSPDDLMGEDNNKTNFNLGKRDAYIYITQMLRFE